MSVVYVQMAQDPQGHPTVKVPGSEGSSGTEVSYSSVPGILVTVQVLSGVIISFTNLDPLLGASTCEGAWIKGR